jgi:hypothetical protein
MKRWNVRDQTTEELENLLKWKYAEINNEEAKFRAKAFANEIEMEPIKRRTNNGEEE